MGRRLTAAIGALIGGLALYLLLSNIGGGLDWKDRLTLDQGGRLELEGLGIFLGLLVGALLGAPLGTYIALRYAGAERAAQTAGGTLVMVVAWSLLAPNLVASGPDDPVILPWLLFGGWAACAAPARTYVERSSTKVQSGAT